MIVEHTLIKEDKEVTDLQRVIRVRLTLRKLLSTELVWANLTNAANSASFYLYVFSCNYCELNLLYNCVIGSFRLVPLTSQRHLQAVMALISMAFQGIRRELSLQNSHGKSRKVYLSQPEKSFLCLQDKCSTGIRLFDRVLIHYLKINYFMLNKGCALFMCYDANH